MKIIDLIVSAVGFAIVFYLVWQKFKSRPSDKYFNDSCKSRRKK